jgi:hypothetical protein
MLLFRPVIVLRTHQSGAALLERIRRYIVERRELPGALDTRVIDGSIGDDTFTIRYGHPFGVVRVLGRVRSNTESLVLLRFHEERVSRACLMSFLAVTAAFGYVLRQDAGGWIEWSMGAVVAAAVCFLPFNGTSAGFREAVSSELEERLSALRVMP